MKTPAGSLPRGGGTMPLFFVAGTLPAGIHSGFHAEPWQHMLVEHVPGDDDHGDYNDLFQSTTL